MRCDARHRAAAAGHLSTGRRAWVRPSLLSAHLSDDMNWDYSARADLRGRRRASSARE